MLVDNPKENAVIDINWRNRVPAARPLIRHGYTHLLLLCIFQLLFITPALSVLHSASPILWQPTDKDVVHKVDLVELVVRYVSPSEILSKSNAAKELYGDSFKE